MKQEIDYEAVLADLEGKRAALDAAIASIRQIVGLAPASVTATANQAENGTILSDSFFNMRVTDAAEKYLTMMKRPKSTREIADALIAGGLITQSANFFNTVFSGLDREDKKQNGKFRKVGNNWGLAAWYPGGSNRSRRAREGEPEAATDDTDSDVVAS